VSQRVFEGKAEIEGGIHGELFDRLRDQPIA